MTRDEMIKKLDKHCTDCDCDTCVLEKVSVKDGGCYAHVSDEILEKHFKMVFGSDDPVNRPAHYTDGKIEVIDFIEDKKLGFCLGNAVKYISRAGKKDPTKEVEDLKKAKWYIERRIKELQEVKENEN